MSKPVSDLVVFTCDGRDRLLERTLTSFEAAVRESFRTRILAIDGQAAASCIAAVRPNVVVRQPERVGYVRSIIGALKQVESEFFFWLEDDWQFAGHVDLDSMLATIQQYDSLVQIRLSKTGPLGDDQKRSRIVDGIYESTVGFSANPSLCRTEHVRAGFQALLGMERGRTLGVDGFEDVLSRYFAAQRLRCAVVDGPGVVHTGYLESTPRQLHMTASIDGEIATHLPVGGSSPPLWRRLYMLAKLARRFGSVGIGQLRDDAYYDLAFRMITVPTRTLRDS